MLLFVNVVHYLVCLTPSRHLSYLSSLCISFLCSQFLCNDLNILAHIDDVCQHLPEADVDNVSMALIHIIQWNGKALPLLKFFMGREIARTSNYPLLVFLSLLFYLLFSIPCFLFLCCFSNSLFADAQRLIRQRKRPCCSVQIAYVPRCSKSTAKELAGCTFRRP